MSLPNKWLPFVHANGSSAVRLFCFPYSGAGASIFCGWRKDLPDFIELMPVQLPGREDRIGERPFTDSSSLVQALAEGIRPYLHRPFAFFGHSMGALLSFELARYLQHTANIAPIHLFVSGHAAPQVTQYDQPIHRLPDARFLQRLRELNGTADEVLHDKELRTLILPVIRADFTLCESYRYRNDVPLRCPITALGGLTDPFISRSELYAWNEQTKERFVLRMFPGDHFYLRKQQSLLLRVLAQELSR